jgi:hypothetical protein
MRARPNCSIVIATYVVNLEECDMRKNVRHYLTAGVGCGAALLAVPVARAGQQPPPPISGVTGTIALEGTVDQTSRAANTVIVKTVDGVRHLFHLTEKTAVHGAESVEVEGVRGLKAGSAVVVHYTGDDESRRLLYRRCGAASRPLLQASLLTGRLGVSVISVV